RSHDRRHAREERARRECSWMRSRTSMSPSPSPFERMRADHRRVLRTLPELEHAAAALEAGPDEARRRLEHVLDALELQFATHMAAEDEIVFPILTNALPSTATSLAPLRSEHDDLRAMVQRLKATLATRASRARNEQVRVQVRDLADL